MRSRSGRRRWPDAARPGGAGSSTRLRGGAPGACVSRRAWLALGLALALLALAGPAAAQQLIERILAVVDGAPVLLSEVEAYAQIQAVAPELALEASIDEHVMLKEAQRLPEAAPTPQEAEAAFADLASRLSDTQRAVLDDGVLRRLSRRQATILKYVTLRFQPQVRVDEQAVRRAYEAEYRGRADAPSYDSVAAQIAERLERRALDERIEAWVAELRRGASIRYNRDDRS